MYRLRTGLKPTNPSRHSPNKLPPVGSTWGTSTPTSVTSVRNPEFSSDMIRVVPLKTVSKTPTATRKSPGRSSGSDETKTSAPQILVQQEERKSFVSPQNDREREVEKLKSKIMSLQKLIEQLRAEIKEKTATIAELEKRLVTQGTELHEELKKLKSTISEKENEIDEKQRVVSSKDKEINELKEKGLKEKMEMIKQFDQELAELKAQHLKDLADRDGKIKVMKMYMADTLKDKSKERQLQLEELTKELKRVTEETDILKSKLKSMKSVNQGQCPNCFVMEKQLQSKITELRDKEIVTIEMQRLCSKMEKQLVQQDELLRQWAKNKGKLIR